jgi:hypothetical protein
VRTLWTLPAIHSTGGTRVDLAFRRPCRPERPAIFFLEPPFPPRPDGGSGAGGIRTAAHLPADRCQAAIARVNAAEATS